MMHEQQAQTRSYQDEEAELEAAMEVSARALERMGITVQDILDELPAVHSEMLDEFYGVQYMREIDRKIAAFHQQADPSIRNPTRRS